MNKMKIILISLAVIIALFLYGNHLRKKKNHLINSSKIKSSYEVVKMSKFTIESMLKWFKSHSDVNELDEYILSRLTKEALKEGGIDIAMPNIDVENSLQLIILDNTHKKIKHSIIVTYDEIEKEIIDLLGNKNLVILE